MFGQFSDWLSTQSSFCSHVFTVWVLVMMAFTRAFSQDPVTAQICSTRKSLKPVVFRHSSTVQGGVSKRNKRACYIAVSEFPLPHAPHHWSLLTAAMLRSVCQLLQAHPCISHLSEFFWACRFPKSLPDFVSEKTELLMWMDPDRLLFPP